MALLFGVALSLYLSSMLTWGEMESYLSINQNSAGSLKLNCPTLLADWETATVKTSVTNTWTETVTPMIQTQVSHGNDMRHSQEIITLAPQETMYIERTANATDVKFNKFILMSITQRPYRQLPSRQGVCSIYVYSILGLSGRQSLFAILSTIFTLIVASASSLLRIHSPLSEFQKKLAQASGLFVTTSLLALISALMRTWGLTIFFDVICALSAMVIFTDILVAGKGSPS